MFKSPLDAMQATSRRQILGIAVSSLAMPVRATGVRDSRFTHVVVGAGTAGCVVARRLSDDPANRVLLIEAGGAYQPPAIDLPAKWFGLSGTAIDWRFMTAAQSHAGNRILPVPRGKVLGGSSAINAMIHHRGTAADYDRWAALGATGWNQAVMAPMFRRSERWLGRPDPRRGANGPTSVLPVEEPTAAALRFIDGAKSAGYVQTNDLNTDPAASVGLNQLAFDGQHRMSSYRAYLVPVLGRTNLTIMTGVQVTALDIKGSWCRGVRYRDAGGERLALADHEVVVAAGAIQSPQLLMLSGVGPAAHLRAVGVRPIVDLPGVGGNLHEHMIFPGVSIEARAPFEPSRLMGVDAVLYARSPHATKPRDIMLNFAVNAGKGPGSAMAGGGCRASFSYLAPHSRGRVSLASADPATPPIIDPNAFGDGRDLAGSLASLEVARAILNGPAFADVRLREINPGPAAVSADDLRAYLLRTAVMFGHSVGTCRMGNDVDAVVDPLLRVHGIDHLRVVDASVIPEIPSAPTNATVLAIAERASDLIGRQDAG
ncbi:GMC family oxidoreductase [Sphingomonas bacterium]|uniref:GMC family oxidoreductase n=1 Tax=Sphingomonas bacterium TaxID=1895847 RepID=UPI0020C61AD8|nr:GMC family oxidoreductase N-terminal domain-containing protein [Sphingomonas bacterium]